MTIYCIVDAIKTLEETNYIVRLTRDQINPPVKMIFQVPRSWSVLHKRTGDFGVFERLPYPPFPRFPSPNSPVSAVIGGEKIAYPYVFMSNVRPTSWGQLKAHCGQGP